MSKSPATVYQPSLTASLGEILLLGFARGAIPSIAISMILYAFLQSTVSPGTMVVIGGGIFALITGSAVTYYLLAVRSRTFEIYDDQVRRESGILTTNYRELDVSDIDEVSYEEGIFDRLTGAGTVTLEPKGSDDGLAIEHIAGANSVYERFQKVA